MEQKVEINVNVLKELFTLAKFPHPKEYTNETILETILKIKTQQADSKPTEEDSSSIDDEIKAELNKSGSNNILVIDDIGVVTYQLKILLSNLGYNVHTAKDIFSGLNAFIKSDYAYLIMDLFVSTEQEGFTLLNETKKIITKNNLKTKIIVITASTKAENKVKCLNGGADIFLKKETGWQDKLQELILEANNKN